jgi:hypothetical protein
VERRVERCRLNDGWIEGEDGIHHVQRLRLVKRGHWRQTSNLRHDAAGEKRRPFENQPTMHDAVSDKADMVIAVQQPIKNA